MVSEKCVVLALRKVMADIENPELQKFYEKNNIDPDDMGYIGSGEFGEAYTVGNGKVLKITTSKSEYKYAQEIQKGKYDGFTTIYDTAEIKIPTQIGSYYIVMEELEQDQDDETMFYEVRNLLETQGLPVQYISHFDEGDYVEEHGEIEPNILKFMNELDNIATDYRRLGIEASDIQPDNIGRDSKGKLKAFDIDNKDR